MESGEGEACREREREMWSGRGRGQSRMEQFFLPCGSHCCSPVVTPTPCTGQDKTPPPPPPGRPRLFSGLFLLLSLGPYVKVPRMGVEEDERRVRGVGPFA